MSLERIEETEGLDYYDLTAHILDCYTEIDRLKRALTDIVSYDKDGEQGICPYGCDCPNIARQALK